MLCQLEFLIQAVQLIELRGALLGLNLAASLPDKRKIWLEMDKKKTARLLGKPIPIITHIWREANRAADFVAGICLSSDLAGCFFTYPTSSLFPTKLSSILQEDKEGKLYSCLIL